MGQLLVSLPLYMLLCFKFGDCLFSPSHSTAGDDYTPGPYYVTFNAGQTSAILMVPTMDDDTTELSEYFKVLIISTDQPSAVEIGSPSVSFVTIEDNDPGN